MQLFCFKELSKYFKMNNRLKFILHQIGKLHLTLLVVVSVLISSCNKDCLKAAGEKDSLTIDLQVFQEINIYGIFDVYIVQDTFNSVEIITNSTLLKNIEIEQIDSVITIKDNNSCYFVRDSEIKIILKITTTEFRDLNFYNASTFYTDDTLHFENFLFRSYGKLVFADFKINCEDHLFISIWNVSGDVKVEGTCKYLQILNHGSTYINAFDVNTRYATVEQRSTGDTKISVSEKLVAEIFDIGNVYYKGNPEIDTNIYSQGTIINAN